MPRRVAFSGKQKKKQLQEKKQRKQGGPRYSEDQSDDDKDDDQTADISQEKTVSAETTAGQGQDEDKQQSHHTGGDIDSLANRLEVQKINFQPEKERKSNVDINTFRLHFFKESAEVIARKKKDALRVIKPVEEQCLECRLQDVYPSQANLDFPKRPPWKYSQSKEQLDLQEHKYFQSYVNAIVNQTRSQDLSFFELNLETWRQLWRVLEISDILLVIADIRHPVLHLPPSLLTHISSELHKHVIIVLNKVDFVPPSLALAWKKYFQDQFPGSRVVFFSSYPRQGFGSEDAVLRFDPSQSLYKKPFQGSFLPIGPEALYHQCREIVGASVDLSAWESKLRDLEESETTQERRERETESREEEGKEETTQESRERDAGSREEEGPISDPSHSQELYKNGVLTIGCIGYPNAGKSSVLNALAGKKVVAVSHTPGRTRHLQTIYLCPTVKLCDCPGLVFPSMVAKSLQVLAGIFPVAQVREPFSVVAYLAKRLDLPAILHLAAPHSPKKRKKGGGPHVWSALDVCDAFAIKHGFFTAKAGRPDSYRAANKILRLAVEGELCLCFKPHNYALDKEQLLNDPERAELERVYLAHSRRWQGEREGRGGGIQ